MMRALLLIFLVCFGALGWANNNQPDRKIAPGDKIRMAIPEEPSLSKNYVVTADGLMLIDFLGAVPVSGLTIREAADRITTRLITERILRKATITMEFMNAPAPASQVVKVEGFLKKLDPITWSEGMRLADLLRIAEVDNDADRTKIVIRKADGAESIVNFSAFNPATNASNPQLSPGDLVRVPNSKGSFVKPGGPIRQDDQKPVPPVDPIPTPVEGFVFVMGGVNKPGRVNLTQGMTLAKAIEAAGGFTARGDQASVKIDRAGAAPSIHDLTRGGGSTALRPNDQIVVEIVGQRRFIQVNGAVRTPGLVDFVDGMTLTQAINAVGGLSGSARSTDVILTPAATGSKPRRVNYDDIIRGYRGDSILQAGDTIDVPGPGGRIQPAPTPKPNAGNGRGGRKTADALIIAGAAAFLIWLIGR